MPFDLAYSTGTNVTTVENIPFLVLQLGSSNTTLATQEIARLELFD